ncbi:MAG: 2-hydroxyacyl-CoA dehydratase [Clostridia bacterium]|nr:2-hydroxyacyl-CoA dehydratase [Clostridia bacterium]
MNPQVRVGIDIGSTTVKIAILNEDGVVLFSDYRRHFAQIQETLAELLEEARTTLGDVSVSAMITGSGGLTLANHLGIPFTQEVVAVATALKASAPQCDVAIELGGEDAKIIYFTGGVDQRMNGICAGGTGSFIDQMAALLQTDAAGLNELAEKYQMIYPIAARCGVFAKSDIQPLINEGATREDLAASIFQAVVNQTISGLACGKPIRGNVAFLGGPLHFLPELCAAFIRTLNLGDDAIIAPDNSHLFAAIGSAMSAEELTETRNLSDYSKQLRSGVMMETEIKRMPPLFESTDEYDAFVARHEAAKVHRGNIRDYHGRCYLGIDAGSTTTKLALIAEDGSLLFTYYDNNQGSPILTAQRAILELQEQLPDDVTITYSCSTGYGEALLKSAFCLDEGEVETIAHYYAAAFFDPQVDCILDIGGQDMKCIRIKDGTVDSVQLNEACSSGCGSFLETFANSLGMDIRDFAKAGLYAKEPTDLGTRCTVFMNSNVKQAQKEGAEVSDISAGLATSVIKNALYKVIKVTSVRDLGRHIVVQGGTFYNDAVLRAIENLLGTPVIRPDIAGIMGAFGAALIAKERYHLADELAATRENFQSPTSIMLPLDEILALDFETSMRRCPNCNNHCILTVNDFGDGREFISGNRCERGLGKEKPRQNIPNLFTYKQKRIFGYKPLRMEDAPRGEVGLPRVLNMYENYPFWATFFKELGFRTVLSPVSSHKLYELGLESIPSESECYPAKLVHGHVEWLISHGQKFIFMPCIPYERNETPDSTNHYNCPIVTSYAENIKNNVETLAEENVLFMSPFMTFSSEAVLTDILIRTFTKDSMILDAIRPVGDLRANDVLETFHRFHLSKQEIRSAAHKAWQELCNARLDIQQKGEETLQWMESTRHRGIVLAGRPYHGDPEVHHGIPELINSYGFAVLTEDSVSHLGTIERPTTATDQWMYHTRLYRAAEYVKTRDDLDLIQLNSFGCGVDAVTADQVRDILTRSGKIYTLLKIDEVNNLGAARIRVRSLIAALRVREQHGAHRSRSNSSQPRVEFTKEMREEGYTILAPQMSPIHFQFLEPVFRQFGYHFVILQNDDRAAVDAGLQYVNNDACYPSLIVVGQVMDALLSGKYDLDRTAVLMTQTGGGCRASNYVGFFRRALEKAGMGQIPVISLNANGMEQNSGFSTPLPMLIKAMEALSYGDILMRVLYATRPYEKEPGSANALHDKWASIAIKQLQKKRPDFSGYRDIVRGIIRDFDALPRRAVEKPKVGIVGEILVKFSPLANNHIVELLESEGAEAVMPDLTDFLFYCMYNQRYKYEHLGGSRANRDIANIGIYALEQFRRTAVRELVRSVHFVPPAKIEHLADLAAPHVSIGNETGEGWFLTGEMMELIEEGVPNIVCTQPFGCLPNHVVGKGVIKNLRATHPNANIIAVDYDPGASEVNQLNRIKLMLSSARSGNASTGS